MYLLVLLIIATAVVGLALVEPLVMVGAALLLVVACALTWMGPGDR